MRVVYRSTLLQDARTGETAATEMLPDSISYTGHDSVEGDRQLKFDYSTGRPDTLVGSEVAGGIFSRDYRLDQIEVLAGNAPLRNYSFVYGTALNNTLRLNSLQECAGSGTVCKPATAFTYFDEVGFAPGSLFPPTTAFLPMGTALRYGGHDRLSGLNATSTTSFSTPIPAGADMAVWAIPAAGPFISAAIDLINLVGESSSDTYWYVRSTYDFLSNSYTKENPCEGRSLPADHVIVDTFGSQSLYETCPEAGYNSHSIYFFEPPRVWLVDVDGDGVQDKLYCDHDQLHLNYKLSQNEPLHGGTTDATDATKDGQILAPQLCVHELDDANGAEITYAGPLGSLPIGSQWRMPVTAAFDVDGDGTGNLLVRTFAPLPSQVSTWEALIFDATGPHFKTLSTDSAREIDPTHFEFQTLDFNGDGLRDILALPSRAHGASIQVPILWVNTGDGFQFQVVDASGDETLGQASHFPEFVLDYDHDGTEELIAPNPGTSDIKSQVPRPWVVRRIRNNRMTSEEMPEGGPGFPGVLGDFDGDGNPDLITQDPEAGYYIHRGSGRRQSLLQTLTDGLGNFVSVNYDNKNLEGGNTYGIGGSSSCTWPTSAPHVI